MAAVEWPCGSLLSAVQCSAAQRSAAQRSVSGADDADGISPHHTFLELRRTVHARQVAPLLRTYHTPEQMQP